MAHDLVAADVITAAHHDDYFGAAGEGWFDLFGDPTSAGGVESALEVALKLLAGEFEKNAFGHRFSIALFHLLGVRRGLEQAASCDWDL